MQTRKSPHSAGRARLHYLLAGISIVASLLVWLLLNAAMQDSLQAEQARVELFWNGYAKLYAEQNGSWTGLQERLALDQYAYTSDRAMSVIFYSANGSDKIAEIIGTSNAAHGRKIAVFSNGAVIGFTQAAIASIAYRSHIIVGFPIALGMMLYAGMLWHVRRIRRAAQQEQHQVAAILLERMNGKSAFESISASQSQSIDESESLRITIAENGSPAATSANSPAQLTVASALQAVDGLINKVNKLETVRRTMVADIAHELRTPIAIMRTQLDHAIQDNLPLPLEKAVALHDETLRLTKLVRDLQELSLAETGNLPLFKSWLSLTELVSEVMETLAIDAEERDISSAVIGDKDIRIYADESRIRQMIINLVGNAFGHARNQVHIKIMLDESETTVTVIVTDDGWGMEEEELSRVFDRFYRGDMQLKRKDRSSGLGLGLAIVREYALAHHGFVQVSSRFGEGTSFRLTLPVFAE